MSKRKITDILTRLAGDTSLFIGVTISAQDKCSCLQKKEGETKIGILLTLRIKKFP